MSGEREALLARVTAAKGPDTTLDVHLFLALGQNATMGGWMWNSFYDPPITVAYPETLAEVIARRPDFATSASIWFHVPALTGSVDAALALVEKKLPGRHIVMRQNDVSMPSVTIAATWFEQAQTLPLAIVGALLRALTATEAKP